MILIKYVTDLVAPTLLVMLISWMTVSMFALVFEVIIDTMLICYLTDTENTDGHPAFADTNIIHFVNENGKLDPASFPKDSETPPKTGNFEIVPSEPEQHKL